MSDTYTNGHDPAPFILRDAQLTDLPAIRRLWGILWEEGQGTIPYPIVTEQTPLDVITILANAILTANPDGRIIVATVNDTVVGFLTAEIATRAICEPKRYLFGHFVIIDPAYRSTGIGRLFVETITAWGRSRGVTMAEISTTTHGAYWERHGWKSYTTVYYNSLDAIEASLAASSSAVTEEPDHALPSTTES